MGGFGSSGVSPPHALLHAKSFAVVVLPTCSSGFAWTQSRKEHQPYCDFGLNALARPKTLCALQKLQDLHNLFRC
jgi:hypothetical protein